MGASGPGTDNYLLAALSNKIFGTKYKIVSGYGSGSAVDLGMERGEVDGTAAKDWTTLTATRPDWIRDKSINILVQMGLTPHLTFKACHSALDLARTPQDKQVLELVFAKYRMGQTVHGAPRDCLPSVSPPCVRRLTRRWPTARSWQKPSKRG